MINYYCSPAGTGNGLSVETPTSFVGAKSLVRSAVGTDNITVWVAGGEYAISETLAFTSLDSGVGEYKVIWRPIPGSTPNLSGGIRVTGWQADTKPGVFKATVPSGSQFRHLYVNGQKATRSFISLAGEGFTEYDDTAETLWYNYAGPFNWGSISRPQDLEGWFQLYRWSIGMIRMNGGIQNVGGTWRIYGYADQMEYQAKAAELASTGYQLPDWPMSAYWLVRDGGWWGFGFPDSDNAFSGDFLRMENAYEFLNSTTKGCWYLNIDTSTLYYVPRDGEDIETAVVIAPQLESILQTDDNAENIWFIGFKFSHSDWFAGNHYNTLLDHGDGGFGNPQYLHYETDLNASGLSARAAVESRRSKNIKFIQCSAENCGGLGFDLEEGAQQVDVLGGYFTGLAGHAIKNMDFHAYSVYDNSVSNVAIPEGQEWREQIQSDSARNADVRILSNKVTKCANTYTGEAGITIGSAERTTVDYNEVYDQPYHGISCRANFGRQYYPFNHRIRKNLIRKVMKVWSDGGGLYMSGAQIGLLAEENFIDDCGNATSSQSMQWPLYMDDNGTGLTAQKNVILKNTNGGPKEWTLMKNWPVPATGNPNWPWPEPTRGLHVDYPNKELNNYYQTGMLWLDGTLNPNPYAVVSGNTAISANPALWPAEVQRIVSEAGPQTLMATEIIEGEVIIYGWKQSEEDEIQIQTTDGTVQDYEEPFDLMWRARITGITGEGLAVTTISDQGAFSLNVGHVAAAQARLGNGDPFAPRMGDGSSATLRMGNGS